MTFAVFSGKQPARSHQANKLKHSASFEQQQVDLRNASMLVRNLVQSSDQNKVINNTNCLQIYDYQITQQRVKLSGNYAMLKATGGEMLRAKGKRNT
jgi:hypothetical protein